jgi:diadenosine tetraphosphate (Ap4A) HIT family hydrolase
MDKEAQTCIFCKIVAGAIPSSKVFEDDEILAFLDIRPINPGHTLVIPKSHAANLAELDPSIGGTLFQISMKIAAALRRSGLRCEGVNFWLADGEAAFQEVSHVHLHVIPRFTGDGFRIRAGPDYGTTPPRDELEKHAAKISEALKSG